MLQLNDIYGFDKVISHSIEIIMWEISYIFIFIFHFFSRATLPFLLKLISALFSLTYDL